MKANKIEIETIVALIEKLSSDDPVIRGQSRDELVQIGGDKVTRALVSELVDPRRQVRWEAAKALLAIADPVSAPGLMHALDDDDQDVRWVAAEGLIALGDIGLMTVLSGLTKRARSLDFCQSAHHVLHDLKQKGYGNQKVYGNSVTPVLKALETSEPEVTAPPAAYEALVAMKNKGN